MQEIMGYVAVVAVIFSLLAIGITGLTKVQTLAKNTQTSLIDKAKKAMTAATADP